MSEINTIKFLSLTGLQAYDAKIKEFIGNVVAEGDAQSFKFVNLNNGALEFYTVNPIVEGSQPAYSIELPEQDLSHLMALVKDATVGNIATFGDNGQVVDSGVKLADLATTTEVQDVLDLVNVLDGYIGDIPSDEAYADISTVIGYINKKAEETLNAASGGSSESAASVLAALNTYKSENDAKVNANAKAAEDAQTAADEAKQAAAAVATDLETETQARNDVDAELDERITALEGTVSGLSGAMNFVGVKEELPTDASAYNDGDVIIVGNKEYVCNDGKFVEFGDVTAISEAVTQLTNDIEAVESTVATKADKDAVDAESIARAQAIETLTQTHNTAVENINEKITTIESDIEALKSVTHQEIEISEIDALFV